MKTTNIRCSILTVVVLAVLAATNAFADKYKANNNTVLMLAASWTNNALPGSSEYGVWDATVAAPNTTNSLGADMTWGGIKIINPGGPVTLAPGNTLMLNGVSGTGIDMSAATVDLTVNCDLTLAASQTFIDPTNMFLTVGGNVSGSGSLTKSGFGTLTLSGNNTFAGGVTISQGSLWIKNSNALGSGSKTVDCSYGTVGHSQLHLDGTGGNLTLPSTINYLVSNWADPGTVYNEGGNNVINGNFTVTMGGGGLVFFINAGSLTLNGIITPNSAGRGVVFNGVGNAVANGVIADGADYNFLFIQQGVGTTTLTAANTYKGTTDIRAGTLLVNGSLASASVVTVKTNATLGGNGTIGGPVIVQAGATLAPGIGSGWIGRMAISNTLTLAGTAVMELNRTNSPNCDSVIGITTLTNGGTLTVTNLGPALQIGDTFTFFNATNYVGSFAAMNLPPLAAGLGWIFNPTSDGTVTVEGEPTSFTNHIPIANTPNGYYVGDPLLTTPTSLGILCPNSDGSLDGDMVYIYNCAGTNTIYTFDSMWPSGFGDQYDAEEVPAPIINPGEGFQFLNLNGGTYNWVVTGTPGVPILPPPNYCSVGEFSLLCEQSINLPGNYQNITGFAPQEGAQEKIWNGSFFDIYTFTGGAWTPSTPRDLAAGEAGFFLVPAMAMSGDKYKANNTNLLNQAASWTNNAVPGPNDFAVWNFIVTAPNTTNTLGADMTWGGIKIINPGGPVTLTGSNTLTLNGVAGIAIDMSNAVQDLTIHCPVTVASNQTWAVASSQMLAVDSLLVNAPFQIGGSGRTFINTMEGEGIFPVDFQGSSFTQIGSLTGNSPLQVDGPTTLALTGNDNCTGPVTLTDGATLQLLADNDKTFGNGTVVTATNATVTILADALTPGHIGQIISFASGGLYLGNVTVNVPGTNAILKLGVVTMLDGPITFTGPGTTHIHGINMDGVFPVDFQGSSYGSPSEIEWSFGDNSRADGCGPITEISELNKGGTNKTLVLWGTNSYAGPTTISGGVLVLAGDNSAVTNKTVVSGPATLALVANANNTHGGVCAALGSTELDLTNGATVLLIADSNTVFGAGTVVTATNATVMLSAGPLTPGQTNQTLTLAGGLSLSNAVVNVPDNGNILALGSIACSGSIQIGGFGRTQIGGIHGDGVFPVDFQGSSYGTPSEYEWAPGCTCGAIDNAGGLNKSGNDVLVLTGINTYTGPTVVSNGALVVNGSLLGGGPVTVTGGTLHGSGVIMGPVTVQAAACLCPDGLVVGNLGTNGQDGVIMTVSNNLSLAGTAWMGINRTNTHNSDRVIGISTFTCGGTLTVTNLGPALQAGDTFTLFSAANYVGSFATLNLPSLNSNLVWDISSLQINGSIRVASAPVTYAGLVHSSLGNATLNVTPTNTLIVGNLGSSGQDGVMIALGDPSSPNGFDWLCHINYLGDASQHVGGMISLSVEGTRSDSQLSLSRVTYSNPTGDGIEANYDYSGAFLNGPIIVKYWLNGVLVATDVVTNNQVTLVYSDWPTTYGVSLTGPYRITRSEAQTLAQDTRLDSQSRTNQLYRITRSGVRPMANETGPYTQSKTNKLDAGIVARPWRVLRNGEWIDVDAIDISTPTDAALSGAFVDFQAGGGGISSITITNESLTSAIASIQIAPVTGGINLSWPPYSAWILQQSSNLLGGWSDMVTTNNSYQVVPAGPGQFYRLRSGP